MLIYSLKRICFFYGTTILLPLCIVSSATAAGAYQDSAHGNGTYGVDRDDLSDAGYSVGNCAHCHEQHTSIAGSEPAPNSPAGPDNFALFAKNFNTGKINGSYIESDNMCFYCHRGTGSTFQQVTNYNYAKTFGGYSGSSITNILDTFNQASYHNLYDIWYYYKDVSSSDFFTSDSNPCVACHNPHRAKRNNNTPANPVNTAISLPSDHENLFGDDNPSERMSQYAYQPPYKYNSSTGYEPVGSSINDGTETPDYISFCTNCHNATNSIYSNNLGRVLTKINWTGSDIGGLAGDLHGPKIGRDVTYDKGAIKSPFDEVSGFDYTLSCLDCHEPHGSANAFLLRQEVNGVLISVDIHDTNDNGGWTELCQACHNITVTSNGSACGSDHGSPSWPLTRPCQSCHAHGSYICGGGNSSF